MARPYKEIDKRQFEELCRIQCTQPEMCRILGVSDKTLTRWTMRTYEMEWREVYELYRTEGKASLRRSQFKMAHENPTMAIWLGKQYLGQRDKHEVEVDNKVQILDDIPKGE